MVLDENVRLKSIYIENWKRFRAQSFDFDSHNNFYNQENGFGKTSLIEAIIFCIYGKLPQGMSISDVQNDKTQKIKFVLTFEYKLNKYVIEREIYPNGKKVCKMKENNEEFVEYSVNQMYEKTSKFFGESKFIDIIWSQAPLIYSDILKSSFVSSLIADYLQEEKEFADSIKTQNLALSKEKKNIERTLASFNGSKEDIEKFLQKMEAERVAITEKLKNQSRSSVNDSKKALAERCLFARQRQSEIAETSPRLYSEDGVADYKALKAAEEKNLEIVKNYSESLNDEINKFKKNFSSSELSKLLKLNEESCKCPVCERDFKFPFTADNLKNFVGKDDYEKAIADLERLKWYKSEAIAYSEEYISLEKDAHLVEDPETILKEYNNQVDEDWKKLENINNQMQQATKCKQLITSLEEITEELQANQKLLEICKRYENEAIDYYTRTVIFHAQQILSSVDKKYGGMYYDKVNATYRILMVGEYSIEDRAVNTFSSGERAVIALCLALAFKEVFAPNTILILDESLGNLDPDKLEICLKILSEREYQTFVVAHNRK